MKKILLTLIALWPLFSLLGCAHQLTWQEREAQRKQAEEAAYWGAPPCARLLIDLKCNEGYDGLDRCLRPGERHSPQELAEMVSVKHWAEKVCAMDPKASSNCAEAAIRRGWIKTSWQQEHCDRYKDALHKQRCLDYQGEFEARHCSAENYQGYEWAKLGVRHPLPDGYDWNAAFAESERRMAEEDRRFREQIDRQYLMDTLQGIEEELIDINSKVPGR